MNRTQAVYCAVGLLFAWTFVALAEEKSSQNQEKSTSQKTVPCRQLLKNAQQLGEEQSDEIKKLEEEKRSLIAINQESEAENKKLRELLDKEQELSDKQEKLLQRKAQSDHDLGLAAGMMLNEVSGSWTIRNGNTGTGGVCTVQVNHDMRTILLSNCRF